MLAVVKKRHTDRALFEVKGNIPERVLDFLKNESHFNDGYVFLNPPYGERLKDKEEIIPFYKEIGTQLKHHYEGCEAWIISSNIQALKFIGLRPNRKIPMYNGPLECKLHKYELYVITVYHKSMLFCLAVIL